MDKPRVLVTGSRGFTGMYLLPLLEALGYDVFGTDRQPGNLEFSDLADRVFTASLLEATQPNFIIHLAGATTIAGLPLSEYLHSNIEATESLLEQAQRYKQEGGDLRKIILASSAQVYGPLAGPLAFESTPVSPRNIYAISKYTVELLGGYWRDQGLPILITRPFNYTGRGQTEKFLIPRLVQAFQERTDSLYLENLDGVRDYLDVRDIVSIYAKLLEPREQEPTVINLCSGRGYSVMEILGFLADLTGHVIKDIKVNPHYRGMKSLVGSPHGLKLFYDIDASQFTPLKFTLQWMLEDL